MKYKEKQNTFMSKLSLATVRKKFYCWRWFECGDYCPINPEKNTKNEICVHLSDDYEYLVDKSYFFEKPDSYFKNISVANFEFKNLIENDYKNFNDIVKKYYYFISTHENIFTQENNFWYDYERKNI